MASMVITNARASSQADTKGRAGRPEVKPSDDLATIARQMHQEGKSNEAIYKEWQTLGYHASKGTRAKHLKRCLANFSQGSSSFPDIENPEQPPPSPNPSDVLNWHRPILHSYGQDQFRSSDESRQPGTRSTIRISPYTTRVPQVNEGLSRLGSMLSSSQSGVYVEGKSAATLSLTFDCNPTSSTGTSFLNNVIGNKDAAKIEALLPQNEAQNMESFSPSMLAPTPTRLLSNSFLQPQEYQYVMNPDLSGVMIIGDRPEQDFKAGKDWLAEYSDVTIFAALAGVDAGVQSHVPAAKPSDTPPLGHLYEDQTSQIQFPSFAYGNISPQNSFRSTMTEYLDGQENPTPSAHRLQMVPCNTGQLSRSAPPMSHIWSPSRASSRGRSSQPSTFERIHKSPHPTRLSRSYSQRRRESTSRTRSIQRLGDSDSGYASQQRSSSNPSFDFMPIETSHPQYLHPNTVGRISIAQGYNGSPQTSIGQELLHDNSNQYIEEPSRLTSLNDDQHLLHCSESNNSNTNNDQTKEHIVTWEEFNQFHKMLQQKGLVSTAATLRKECKFEYVK